MHPVGSSVSPLALPSTATRPCSIWARWPATSGSSRASPPWTPCSTPSRGCPPRSRGLGQRRRGRAGSTPDPRQAVGGELPAGLLLPAAVTAATDPAPGGPTGMSSCRCEGRCQHDPALAVQRARLRELVGRRRHGLQPGPPDAVRRTAAVPRLSEIDGPDASGPQPRVPGVGRRTPGRRRAAVPGRPRRRRWPRRPTRSTKEVRKAWCIPWRSGLIPIEEAIQNPDHEQREAMLEWVGGRSDPEVFDPAKMTKAMRKGLPEWRSMAGGASANRGI